MSPNEILFHVNGQFKSPDEIRERINKFGNSYSNTIYETIHNSKVLDSDGQIFYKWPSRLLSNFGMTRRGPFHENSAEILHSCWIAIGARLIEINNAVRKSGLSRDRYIIELSDRERNGVIAEIWQITKELLQYTMGDTCYGLVGASKILFSVLPEIVLPVDNAQWLHVFKTVDLGDVIYYMASDIKKWEGITGVQLNRLDRTERLTTIPSVYNVMAMLARPKKSEI
ncbi:MAG: hypothetical protein C3F13_08325 [Anaerolineales bacterium]|nr:MAG: hypothetical protein C3F13_08325 [Anaerolineales bacterium]